ncbi:sigma-70 family RNA polymerase sigma factor [Sorangium cellulosum]|nr:sigma-70 family RNA polymerase sigma factor [Sorangium cellulosum]
MHKTREILRQKWLLGRTHRQTATSNGTSPGAVGSVLARAKAAGLTTWEQVTQLDDEALERALYGTSVVEPGVAPRLASPRACPVPLVARRVACGFRGTSVT